MLHGLTPFLRCKMQCLFYFYLTLGAVLSISLINVSFFYSEVLQHVFQSLKTPLFLQLSHTIWGLACCKQNQINIKIATKKLSRTFQS